MNRCTTNKYKALFGDRIDGQRVVGRQRADGRTRNRERVSSQTDRDSTAGGIVRQAKVSNGGGQAGGSGAGDRRADRPVGAGQQAG